jgi:restriction system protein
MWPLLRVLRDGKEHAVREVVEELVLEFRLTPKEQAERLPSGRSFLFENRVGWARYHLKLADFISAPRRGVVKISPRGVDLLNQGVNEITLDLLKQYPEYQKSLDKQRKKEKVEMENESNSKQTPDEFLEEGYQKLREELARELMDKVKNCSPRFFERLVVDLLVKMGYGGSLKDAGQAVGGSGDDGIDGIINEDRLGLDVIYLQAKRWEATVGRPHIQKFAGALQGKRARKGVFITTSDFSKDARDYVSQIDSKIILMDGETLARHMIDFNVGVSTVTSYDIKKIDSDYFEGE